MRSFLFLLLLCCSLGSFAQNPTYQEKLYYTCKVWGFLKYYHSEVSVCKADWDAALKNHLPAIKTAASFDDFNDELNNLINEAGPMALVTTPMPDTLPPELKRNKDFSWFNDALIRSDVRTKLKTVEDHFLPHRICWVEHGTSTSGWLNFPFDNPILPVNTMTNYPGELDRILLCTKYWNIINYFNPYNYVLDKPWDSTLYEYIIRFADAGSTQELSLLVERMTARLDDAHVEGLTWTNAALYYRPRLRLMYVENQYVVVKTDVAGVNVGDVIESVDGLTPSQWEDSLRPYIAASNPATFHREMCRYILSGTYNTNITVKVKNASGNTYTTTGLKRINPGTWYSDYYINDSLAKEKWRTLPCNVGYVNMGTLNVGDELFMYADLKDKPVIVFDIRNYPKGTAWGIASMMFDKQKMFAKDAEPDIEYPGTYKWYYDYQGGGSSVPPYTGKVILLVNEETQSQAEYSCMMLEQLDNVTKIGSQTAGADGNITYFNLTNDIQTGFTTLGIYYPNGDSTQRIGIVPDTLAYPTIAGIRQRRDEVLEKAIQTACEWLSVPEHKKAKGGIGFYPNPAGDNITIESSQLNGKTADISIADISGKILIQRSVSINSDKTELDIRSLSPGIYIMNISSEGGTYHSKLIKL